MKLKKPKPKKPKPLVLTWSDALSPKVQSFIEKYNGKGVAPETFRQIMKDFYMLTEPERTEFLFFQHIHRNQN